MDILKKLIPLTVFTVGVFSLSRALFLDTYPDFRTYYYAPQAFLLGQNPYLPGEGFTEFLYPPYALLFFMPLIFLPFEYAEKVWTVVSIVFLFSSICLLNKIAEGRLVSGKSLVICGMAGIFFPVKFTLGMGQVNNLLLFLVCLALWFFFKKKEYISGFLLGFSYALKPFPVLLLPYFIFLRKWRIAAFVIITFVAVNIFSLLFMEIDIFRDYFMRTFLETALSWKIDYYNQAWSGFVARIISDDGLRNTIRILGTAFFLGLTGYILALQSKRKKRLIELEISIIITVSLIVNSFSWQHHFVFLLIPFTFLFHHLFKKKYLWISTTLLIISFVLTAINIPDPDAVPLILQSHVLYGTIVLWVMLLFFLKRKYA